MTTFADTVQNQFLKDSLCRALDGSGSFRRFKDTLAAFQKEKKLWHGFNAKASRKEIEEWLAACGISSQQY